MLTFDELHDIAARFGVDQQQVRRDHLISHLLAAISTAAGDSVIFFGGTALARSILTDGRLSEDIDLLALGRRAEQAARLQAALPRALRREYPRLAWEQHPARPGRHRRAAAAAAAQLHRLSTLADPNMQ
jgi:hypothetical protein